MAHERIKPEFLFDEEKIKQLKQIAPECFEDGKLNFETLRQNLGDWAQDEEDGDLEHFGLFWPGKKDARRLATIPPEGTLEPVYGEGLKSDGTPDDDGLNDSKNIFIEGENLEVLKILQKSYANKIKMIYIDPPYNTGEDFIYDDNFTETVSEYLKRTGQIDEEGKPLTTNKKSDGRFHSKWLSMMYPRLKLARNILKDDGLIFISIDDNEVANLVSLMNEIFGEENKEGLITWRRRHNQPNDKTKVIGKVAEYILVYSKNNDELKTKGTFYGVPLSETRIKDYKNPDNDPKGRWSSNPWKAAKGRGGTKYTIITPEGVIHDETWYGNEQTFDELIKDNRVHWTDKGKGVPRIKIYLSEAMKNGQSAINFFTHDKYGSNQEGSAELEKLFDGNKVFDNPKPTRLLKSLMNIGTGENDIIMDFFAGSGSLGHAFYEFCAENKVKNKFILCQLPHKITNDTEAGRNALKLGYSDVSELCKDRLNKVLNNCKPESNGYRHLRLNFSNYKKWNDVQGEDISQLENSLDLFNSSPLREDWNKNKLLTELILLEGFPLDATQSKSTIGSNEIVKVESEMVPNTLLICLDDEIEESLIDQLELGNASTFICLDSAISNQNKLRLSDKGLIKTI